MNPMKRLGLVALLVVGVTLLASTPARAKQPGWSNGGETAELANVCVWGDQDAEATGQVTYRGTYFVWESPDSGYYVTHMSISCQNLRPGATYGTPMGTFTADGRGRGKAAGWVTCGYYRCASVARVDGDGSWTEVLADPAR